MTRAVVNLDALAGADALPRVTLLGREHPVGELTGGAAHRLAVVQREGTPPDEALDALLAAVRSCVPSLTAEEVAGLTIGQITAVVRIARGQIDAVEAEIAERDAGN